MLLRFRFLQYIFSLTNPIHLVNISFINSRKSIFMKKQTNILLLLMGAALISLNSCFPKLCGCSPPEPQSFSIALFDRDSTSLHLHPDFNLDSTQYLKPLYNIFVKSDWENDGKNLKRDLEIFRDTLYFHHLFSQDRDIDTTIYLSLLPNDVDTLSYSYKIFENKNPEAFMVFNRDTFKLDTYTANNKFQYFKK